MIEIEIGDIEGQRRNGDRANDKQHRHAGKEHLKTPGQDNHRRHANIGLQHQNGDKTGQQRGRIDPAGKVLSLTPEGQEPCRNDGEKWFCKFGWLQIEAEQGDPSGCALNLAPGNNGHDHQADDTGKAHQ